MRDELSIQLRKRGNQLHNERANGKVGSDIDCGYTLEPPQRGGSNKYPQSMFWSKNKKNRYTPANPFYYIKVGFKGVFIARTCFPDAM